MGVFTPEQFSRTQTTDLETAIADAVMSALNRPFPVPGTQREIQLAELYDEWPDIEDNFVDPSAVVLPDTELLYGPSHPTPVLLEDTWEPKGEMGFGLYELSEASREFEVAVRTSTAVDRQALKAGIETAFQNDDNVLVAPSNGVRYGMVVPMPGYWGLPCRLTLLASRKLDDPDTAARKIEELRFRIVAQAQHVKLGRVPPFRLRLAMYEQAPDGSLIAFGENRVTPPPQGPSLDGLVQRLRGDLGITLASPTRPSNWNDVTTMYAQHVQQSNPSLYPYMLGDSIDGIPLLEFGLAGDANKSLQTAVNFKNRLGVDMNGAHPRTVIVVIKPKFDAAYGVTGGKPWSIDNSWCPMFELNPNFVTNGAYAWERFIDDYTNARQWGPQTNGSGGPFDGRPIVCEWTSTGSDLAFLVNNVLISVTPAGLYGSSSAVGPASISINFVAFHGGIAEALVWDAPLVGAGRLQTLGYLQTEYPSVGL